MRRNKRREREGKGREETGMEAQVGEGGVGGVGRELCEIS